MPEHTGAAADQAVAANAGATGYRRAAGHGRVRADADVVCDLDLVVETHIFFKHGVAQRAAIDGGVGTDLAVVADDHATQLRHFQPLAAIHGQAEAVGANDRAWMDQHARADPHAGDQGNPGNQMRAGSDMAILADAAMRTDHCAGADAGTGGDGHQCTDMGAGIHFGVDIDHGTRVDTGQPRRPWLEQRGDTREIGVGIATDQYRTARVDHRLGGGDDRSGCGLRQLSTILGIGQETELIGLRRLQSADADDGQRAIAVDFKPESVSQLSQRNRAHG